MLVARLNRSIKYISETFQKTRSRREAIESCDQTLRSPSAEAAGVHLPQHSDHGRGVYGSTQPDLQPLFPMVLLLCRRFKGDRSGRDQLYKYHARVQLAHLLLCFSISNQHIPNFH